MYLGTTRGAMTRSLLVRGPEPKLMLECEGRSYGSKAEGYTRVPVEDRPGGRARRLLLGEVDRLKRGSIFQRFGRRIRRKMDFLKESWVFLDPALRTRANQASVLDSGLPGNVSRDFLRI